MCPLSNHAITAPTKLPSGGCYTTPFGVAKGHPLVNDAVVALESRSQTKVWFPQSNHVVLRHVAQACGGTAQCASQDFGL